MKKDELLEIAKQTIQMNKHRFALTGSLMCYCRGIKTRREPTDIDLIGDVSVVGDIEVPEGFVYYDQEGGGSDLQSVVFKHKDLGVKIDFLYSETGEDWEDTEDENLILGDLQEMISAKINYAQNDNHIESRLKHLEDLLEMVGVMNEVNYFNYCDLIKQP